MIRSGMGFRVFTFAALLGGTLVFANAQSSFAQEKEESSRREAEVMKRVEACGGRIMQISSADNSREVSFYLAGKNVKDEHLKDIVALKEVVWLNLANTGVTDAGLKEIVGLNLKKLHLEKTGVGDAGLMHLKDMKDLEYLNLYATSVTDAGLKHLEGLSNLKKLYVWQSKVTKEGMKALEGKIAGLKIIGESKLPVPPPPAKKKEAEKKKEAKKETPADKLKAREAAVQQKEKELKAKEEALKKREEALSKQEQELKDKAEKK